MLSYCLKSRKNRESKNPEVLKTKTERIMDLSIYSVCNSQKLIFLKEQEVKERLSSLGLKTTFSLIPLLGPILFYSIKKMKY